MPRAIYVQQYGAYWRLTVEEWVQLLRDIIADGGYQLSNGHAGLGHRLAGRPRHVFKLRYSDERKAISIDSRKPLYSVLDWTPENATDALKEVDEWSRT